MEEENEKIDVVKLKQQDVALFAQLVRVFREVFELEKTVAQDLSYLQQRLDDPSFIVFVVVHGEDVIGGLTAYELANYYAEDAEVFIYDIGIKTEFQRMGLGARLIEALKGYCREKGIKEFFVDALKDETNAVDFYEATGGLPEKVIQFSYHTEA